MTHLHVALQRAYKGDHMDGHIWLLTTAGRSY